MLLLYVINLALVGAGVERVVVLRAAQAPGQQVLHLRQIHIAILYINSNIYTHIHMYYYIYIYTHIGRQVGR